MPKQPERFSVRIGLGVKQYKEALLLLGICVAAFGLFIPFLGYFWDDWTTLYLMKTSSSAADFIYAPYRPLHAILDFITFWILGIAPIGWHILSLVLRWISAILVFLLMKRLAPGKRFFAFAVAAIFAVYPSFHQQSSALIYRQHWTTYIFFLGSLLLMIEVVRRKPGKRIWVLLLALLATLAHLLTTEYLAALELLRPIVLWAVIPARRRTKRTHLQEVLRHWLPYLLVFIGFFVWRFALLELPADPNPPVLIPNLIGSPLQTSYALIQTGLKDLVTVLWSSWTDLLRPDLFAFSDIVGPLIWVLLLLITPMLFFTLSKLVRKEDQAPPQEAKLLLILGVAGLLLGLGTSWIVGREVSTGLFSNRLTMPAMLGASILVALLLFSLVPKPTHRNLILALMLGLATSGHLRQANEYRIDWERQRRAAWQFFWRAPTLAPGTAVIGDGGLTTYLQEYNVSFAINLWYGQDVDALTPPYWFEDFFSGLQTQTPEAIAEGVRVRGRFYGVGFDGNTHQSLMVVTNESPCLWFLSPADAANPLLDPRFAAATQYTDPAAVITDTESDPSAIIDIFGPEPDLGWCMLFQRAGLRAQLGDWDEVVSLWKDAERREIDPYNGYELLNFLRAQAEIGDWEKASELTLLAYEITPRMKPMLCSFWNGDPEEPNNEPEYVEAFRAVNSTLDCGQ
ncbi:MAG: hypothetical protein ACRDFQ_08105 [Anaerolineales bacterium]